MSISITVVEPSNYNEFRNVGEVPERALLAAVLWRAFYDLAPEALQEDRRSAIVWFRGTVYTDRISFSLVSQHIPFTDKEIATLEAAVRFAEALEEERHDQRETQGQDRRTTIDTLVAGACRRTGKSIPAIFRGKRYRRSHC